MFHLQCHVALGLFLKCSKEDKGYGSADAQMSLIHSSLKIQPQRPNFDLWNMHTSFAEVHESSMQIIWRQNFALGSIVLKPSRIASGHRQMFMFVMWNATLFPALRWQNSRHILGKTPNAFNRFSYLKKIIPILQKMILIKIWSSYF